MPKSHFKLPTRKILTNGVELLADDDWMDDEDKEDNAKLNALTLAIDNEGTENEHHYLVIDRDYIISHLSKKDRNLLVGASILFHKMDAKREISDGFEVFWSVLTNITEAFNEKERQENKKDKK